MPTLASRRTPVSRALLGPTLLVGSLLLLPVHGLTAQDNRTPPVPSTIVPNFDRVRIGQVEGLEGGAFVARTGDSGSNWYNPAGLASAESSGLNASSTAYEWTTVGLEGVDQRFESGRFRSLGTYFAGVLGGDVLKDSRLRLGFSVTRPVVWSPGAVTGAVAGAGAAGGERADFYSSAEMSTMVPALNAGFRVSDGLRLGGGVSMGITSLKTDQELADRLVTGSEVQRRARSLTFDGQYWQMQFTAGVQWDLHERVRFGATVTTPGIGLGGSALLISQSSSASAAGTEERVFRDSNTAFAYELPSRAVGGLAVTLGRLEVEADVRYYGSREAFEFLQSDSSGIGVTTDASGQPTTEQLEFEPIVESLRSVTNLALGLNYPLSGSWRLHAGAFTDGSPVGDPATSTFGVVDLTGVTFAVSFGGRLSGSLGLSSSWGTTDEVVIGPSLGGAVRATTVDIRTINLHYALSYTFN